MRAIFGTAFSLFLFISYSAFADENAGAFPAYDGMPEPAAVICFDPASGDQQEIAMEGFRACPAGQEVYLLVIVEQMPGADPLPYEPEEQSREGHAPPNQK
jgi:hypothetical protein